MREWMASKLVRLACWIQPTNKEYMQFMTDRMVELVISGRSTIKVTAVDHDEMYTITTPK